MIFDGFVHQLPDIDPDETQEWLDSARRRRRRPRQDPGRASSSASCSSGPASCRSASPPRCRTPYVNTIPPEQRAVVPRRRAHRAPHPRLHPLERGGDGHQGQQARRRHRRPPVHVRLVGQPLRGRLQPLLPGQGRRPARRPRLLPGPRRARHLRPRLPRGPARPRTTSTTSAARSAGAGSRQLPPPAADARLLGVPDGVDGPRPDQRRSTRPASTATSTTASSTTRATARVWCFVGDGECDEPETLGAHLARRAASSSTTSSSSSTATCSASTVRCAATARSSRSSRPCSAAPAGT